MKRTLFMALWFISLFGLSNFWITNAGSYTTDQSKFSDLMQYWINKTETEDYLWSIQYYKDARTLCSKSDVYKEFKEICDDLTVAIAESYTEACSNAYEKKNYIDAKQYCLESIVELKMEFDYKHPSLYRPYIILWIINFEEKEYWNAKSYFDGAYLNATTEDEKKLAKDYVEQAHKNMPKSDDSDLPEDVKAILDSVSSCNQWYIHDWVLNKCIPLWEDCSNWYIYDELKQNCVPDTNEQRSRNCTARYGENAYMASNWEDCLCGDWYIYDDEADECLIDRDQKSIQSRIINTKDAKCDDPAVVLTCALEPRWDACPAVCLELYDAIDWMYNNELTIYNDPAKFWIYNEITREQASKFFVNFYKTVFNKTLIANPQNPFKDINNADPTLYNYILNANALGLFKGSNWKFMPFNHLTKAQAIAVIIRMATWLLDETQNPRYSNYIQRAQSMNLLDNISYSYNTLDSEDIMRWDVALILYRLYENLR